MGKKGRIQVILNMYLIKIFIPSITNPVYLSSSRKMWSAGWGSGDRTPSLMLLSESLQLETEGGGQIPEVSNRTQSRSAGHMMDLSQELTETRGLFLFDYSS